MSTFGAGMDGQQFVRREQLPMAKPIGQNAHSDRDEPSSGMSTLR